MVLAAAPVLAATADKDGYANSGVTLDGIGKSYMGREIAAVMGHEGAEWLDRPERDKEEGSTRLVPLLGLKPTDVVAVTVLGQVPGVARWDRGADGLWHPGRSRYQPPGPPLPWRALGVCGASRRHRVIPVASRLRY